MSCRDVYKRQTLDCRANDDDNDDEVNSLREQSDIQAQILKYTVLMGIMIEWVPEGINIKKAKD